MTLRRTFHFATIFGGALTALLLCLCGRAFAASPDVSKAPAGASACLGCHGASETELPSLKNLTAQEIENAMERWHHARDNDNETIDKINKEKIELLNSRAKDAIMYKNTNIDSYCKTIITEEDLKNIED